MKNCRRFLCLLISYWTVKVIRMVGEVENIFFISNRSVCKYCENKQNCREFTYLTHPQLQFMLHHKRYFPRDPFCKKCVVRIIQKLKLLKVRNPFELVESFCTSTESNFYFFFLAKLLNKLKDSPFTTFFWDSLKTAFNHQFIFVNKLIWFHTSLRFVSDYTSLWIWFFWFLI